MNSNSPYRQKGATSMNVILLLSLVLSCSVFAIAQTEAVKLLKVGDNAPDFSLPYATRDSVANDDLNLSDFLGKRNVVLAFYPADWSGGCTKEVCAMRDNFSVLSELDAEILGISGDYAYSHHEWAKHHELPFKLVSDHQHLVARMYSSYNNETGYNKRTVFIIDKEGKVAYTDMQYSTKTLDSFNKLQEALKSMK